MHWPSTQNFMQVNSTNGNNEAREVSMYFCIISVLLQKPKYQTKVVCRVVNGQTRLKHRLTQYQTIEQEDVAWVVAAIVDIKYAMRITLLNLYHTFEAPVQRLSCCVMRFVITFVRHWPTFSRVKTLKYMKFIVKQ